MVDSYRRKAWRAEARARMAESRGGVPTADHRLLWHLNRFDACNICLHQPSVGKCKWPWRTTFFTKHHAYRKILKYKLCKAVDPSRKVPDLNCGVQDLLLLIRGSGSQIRERERVYFPHSNNTWISTQQKCKIRRVARKALGPSKLATHCNNLL